jgi:hypothetical protein
MKVMKRRSRYLQTKAVVTESVEKVAGSSRSQQQ